MTPTLQVEDLTPFEPSSRTEDQWLSRLQARLRAEDFVIQLGDAAQREDGFIVYRDARSQWWAGRYIGEIAYEGRRIEIAPRFGTEVIGRWLEGALNLVAVPETAEREPSESFIALLLAMVCARALERASRHAPPPFRRDHTHRGLFVRGCLDVRETVRLRVHGSSHVASVRRQRDLDNDVTRALVLAERALQELIGNRHWHTPRVRDVLPQLIAAVGARPRLPSERALQRIRYTPITRPFKEAAWLSWHIARREGFGAQSEAGDAEGILLDVAELWELFLLHCVRLAAPDLSVEHGTTATETPFLLSRVADPSFGMGKLKPDIVLKDGGELVAVIDAKYKRLEDVRPEKPFGVESSDLYQLGAYLSRLDPKGLGEGMLRYPLDPEREESTAEVGGRWKMAAGSQVQFCRIPVSADEAVDALRTMLADVRARKANAGSA